MASKNGNKNTLLALAVGAIAGAGIALLLAPQSGEKTRRDVRRLGKKALDKTQSLQAELCSSIDNMADEVWEKVREDLDQGRKWTEKSFAELQRVLNSGRDYIRDGIDKIRG
ncbi:MAG: YtxH domain-containing protein [Acidobacteria bacterium]|nr:YtxH domain-containing protein [Acidobacteriota bacterium]